MQHTEETLEELEIRRSKLLKELTNKIETDSSRLESFYKVEGENQSTIYFPKDRRFFTKSRPTVAYSEKHERIKFNGKDHGQFCSLSYQMAPNAKPPNVKIFLESSDEINEFERLVLVTPMEESMKATEVEACKEEEDISPHIPSPPKSFIACKSSSSQPEYPITKMEFAPQSMSNRKAIEIVLENAVEPQPKRFRPFSLPTKVLSSAKVSKLLKTPESDVAKSPTIKSPREIKNGRWNCPNGPITPPEYLRIPTTSPSRELPLQRRFNRSPKRERNTFRRNFQDQHHQSPLNYEKNYERNFSTRRYEPYKQNVQTRRFIPLLNNNYQRGGNSYSKWNTNNRSNLRNNYGEPQGSSKPWNKPRNKRYQQEAPRRFPICEPQQHSREVHRQISTRRVSTATYDEVHDRHEIPAAQYKSQGTQRDIEATVVHRSKISPDSTFTSSDASTIIIESQKLPTPFPNQEDVSSSGISFVPSPPSDEPTAGSADAHKKRRDERKSRNALKRENKELRKETLRREINEILDSEVEHNQSNDVCLINLRLINLRHKRNIKTESKKKSTKVFEDLQARVVKAQSCVKKHELELLPPPPPPGDPEKHLLQPEPKLSLNIYEKFEVNLEPMLNLPFVRTFMPKTNGFVVMGEKDELSESKKNLISLACQ